MNQVDREKLYFNKYMYRGVFETKHLYYIHDAKNIDQYVSNLAHARSNARTYSWRKTIADDSLIDFDLIEKIINFKSKHFGKSITFRSEGDKLAVFTNDLQVVSEMPTVQPNASLTQVVLNQIGVKYFKNKPPSKYRVYLRDRKITEETRDLFRDFCKRDIADPCDSLTRTLNSKNSWKWSYINKGQFINYDDETTLSYMGLMFPELIGKSYKLEKKTD